MQWTMQLREALAGASDPVDTPMTELRRRPAKGSEYAVYYVNCEAVWCEEQENILTYPSPPKYPHLHNRGEPVVV